MKRHSLPHGRSLAALVAVMALAVLAPAAEDNSYTAHNLVADTPGTADHTDPNLVNAWGLAASPTSPWWVADNGTDVSTIYRADGTAVPLIVQVPSRPTGLVFWSFTMRAVCVEVAGQGQGFGHGYDRAGNLLARVAQHGQLNSPWGLAMGPASFGRFSGDLLVGNFGDRQINAYQEMPNGHFEHRGELRHA